MAPSDFIQARSEPKNDEFFHVCVDGKPYFPSLHVTIEDPSNSGGGGSWVPSCQRAVAAIFDLSEESSSSSSLTVQRVQGGNTNVLFCVSQTAAAIEQNNNKNKIMPEKVLVRIFGGHGLIDRDIETSTYAALAKQGLALPYYGRFGNGRIEGWSDWKCLKEEDLGKLQCCLPIARTIATLHSTFEIPCTLQQYHNPNTPPTMWVQLIAWIQTAVPAGFLTPHDTERAQALKLETWQNELTFLKEQVIAKEATIGFCHNDVLASNIMFDDHEEPSSSSNKSEQQQQQQQQPGRVQLIDFELLEL